MKPRVLPLSLSLLLAGAAVAHAAEDGAIATAPPPAPVAAAPSFDAAQWKAAPAGSMARKALARSLEDGRLLKGLSRAAVVEMLGAPDTEIGGILTYGLGEGAVAGFDATKLMVYLDDARLQVAFVALQVPDGPVKAAGGETAERRFDAAAWPRTLVIDHPGAAVGSLTPAPDQTRKAMVQDLIVSHRLVGLSKAEIVALLGKPQDESAAVMVWGLGDKPLGVFNPYALAVAADEAGKVVTAFLVDRSGNPL
jgi:hypothetical protein